MNLSATDPTAHPTAQRLLWAILCSPRDDQIRLIYADWLEEHGDDVRAEFIRAQVRLPHAEGNCGCESPGYHPDEFCERCRLRRRSRTLLHERVPYMRMDPKPERGQVWAGDLIGFTLYPCSYIFARGFVDTIFCSCQQWTVHGPAIMRQHPITQVILSDRKPRYESNWSLIDWRRTWDVEQWRKGPPAGWVFGPNFVPLEIHTLLRRGKISAGLETWRTYDSEEEAQSDLAHAALLWARREAGLEVLCCGGRHGWPADPCPECKGTGWKQGSLERG